MFNASCLRELGCFRMISWPKLCSTILDCEYSFHNIGTSTLFIKVELIPKMLVNSSLRGRVLSRMPKHLALMLLTWSTQTSKVSHNLVECRFIVLGYNSTAHFHDFSDLEGLKRVSEEGACMGYTGKQVIHPNQVPVVRQAFSPSPERVKWATGLIEAFHKHQKSGKVSLIRVVMVHLMCPFCTCV